MNAGGFDWSPASKFQELAVNCKFPEMALLGGRGGGKTDALIIRALLHCCEFPGAASVRFYRQTLKEAEDLIKQIHSRVAPYTRNYRKTDRKWELRNGSVIQVKYLDDVKDAGQGQGDNITMMIFDEIGKYPDPEPIDRLRASLRTSVAGVTTHFFVAANPAGKGHGWVKERYVDPAPDGWTPFDLRVSALSRATRECVMLPSTVMDNPHIVNREEYIDNILMSGNIELVRAWLLGRWDINIGAYFGGVFDKADHVVDPFPIPDHWPRWRAMDWGSNEPFCILYCAIDDRENIWIFDEIYGCDPDNNRKGLKLAPPAVADMMKAKEAKMSEQWVAAGEDAWGWNVGDFPGNPGYELELDQVWANLGVEWFRPDKSKGSRQVNFKEISTRFHRVRWPDGLDADLRPRGGLYVFRRCEHLIHQLQHIPMKDNEPEEVDKSFGDHAIDALRYAVDIWREGAEPPSTLRIRSSLERHPHFDKLVPESGSASPVFGSEEWRRHNPGRFV